MTIGTIEINIFGELNFRESVERFQLDMTPIIKTISDDFKFDSARFAYYSARIHIFIPLKVFWKTDALFNSLRRSLNTYFNNWQYNLRLNILERRD
ncbi:hypothetical protein ES705_14428 [subsurface metagenome]